MTQKEIIQDRFNKWLQGKPGILHEAEISYIYTNDTYTVRLFKRDPQPEFIHERKLLAWEGDKFLENAILKALDKAK